MLADLREERERVEEAIITVVRLARGRGKRRGRPTSLNDERQETGTPAPAAKTSRRSHGGIEVIARLFNGKECAVQSK